MTEVEVRLPHNGWRARPHQRALWSYLRQGGTRAVEVAHRRWGKDEVALHFTAIASQLKIGTYWHMLPEASQAKKAIWNAVNPHTGLRRIDEAFPEAMRESTNNQEMFIRFKNGSTWQVVGSDNFNSLVGSPPVGVIFSEFSIANPRSWGILRPILLENGGWALFIYTPRGKNHGYKLLKSAEEGERWFSEVSPISKTKAIPREALDEERREMVREFGEDHGNALYMQEWECSFEAALLGAFYGLEMQRLQERDHICQVDYDPELPTYTAWDLGWTDDTAIWWYQVTRGEIHVIDFYAGSGATVEELAQIILSKPYKYAKHYLPHDARAKTLAAQGKSIVEQLAFWLEWKNLEIYPELSVQDGIQAVRMTLPLCWFDAAKCEDGLEALRQYQREYDEDKKAFKTTPRHDWASHPADGFRGLAVAWRQVPREPAPQSERPLLVGPANKATLNDMWATHRPTQGQRL